MHLVFPLKKLFISIVFDLPKDNCNTQKKWKAKGLQNLVGGGGGEGRRGKTRCIMGDVLLANIPFSGHFLTIVKRGHIAALLTLKSKWFDTLTGEIKINNDVLLFSATNEKTPDEKLLQYWLKLNPLPEAIALDWDDPAWLDPHFPSGIEERWFSHALAFHLRSRFTRSTIPEGKWGSTRRGDLYSFRNRSNIFLYQMFP